MARVFFASPSKVGGMRDYVISLKPKTDDQLTGRVASGAANLSLTDQFRRELLHMIREQNLEHDVDTIAPGRRAISGRIRLPFIGIRTTPRVAARISEMPAVECVVEDNKALSLID